jgi:hypothetical protein
VERGTKGRPTRNLFSKNEMSVEASLFVQTKKYVFFMPRESPILKYAGSSDFGKLFFTSRSIEKNYVL